MTAEFCDTNIIVYAYDQSDQRKSQLSHTLLDRLWTDRAGVLSIQVLQELYVTLARRTPGEDSRAIVADLAQAWRVMEPVAEDVIAAIDGSHQWNISFWDAMIVISAIRAQSNVLWTEDLQHGRRYGGVLALNPFQGSTDFA